MVSVPETGGSVVEGMPGTFSHVRQTVEELIELLLTFRELSAPAIVDPEAVHDAVDDQESVLVASERLGKRVQEFELMLFVMD